MEKKVSSSPNKIKDNKYSLLNKDKDKEELNELLKKAPLNISTCLINICIKNNYKPLNIEKYYENIYSELDSLRRTDGSKYTSKSIKTVRSAIVSNNLFTEQKNNLYALNIKECIKYLKLLQNSLEKNKSSNRMKNKLSNKKYKNNYGILQSEINNINEKSEKDNFSYMNTIKDMKTELKNQLTEKMALLQEINNLGQIITKIKEENLKLKDDLDLSEKTKEKFEQLFNEYKKMNQENEELNIELNQRKNNNKDLLETINDKYEQEEFELKSEINIWKNNFLNITKFKLSNYEPKIFKKIETLLNIDEKYILNAPQEQIITSEKVLNLCKNLIEEVNYNTINLKDLKEELTKEQENNIKLFELLEKEKYLRRKVNNRYMYLRGNMRVMTRLRPFLPNEIKNKKSQMETIFIKNDSIIVNEINKQPKIFEFDYVFNEHSTQEDVYEEVTLLIQSMVQGNNICIMSYGQTCTGKTYTIQGEENNKGIASRAAEELFDIFDNLLKKNNNLNKKNNKNITNLDFLNNPYFVKARLTMTIIEIYNEQIFNLLEESTPNLSIYEDSNGNLIIPDLSPVNINNFEEANKLFKLAEKFRHIAATEFNERSSRSHCIFSFHVKLTDNENKITRSTLHVIDLAGSERISKGQNNNERIKKEAISINLSLHSLSNVLSSIANKSNHIPYRDSKLTHFLKNSLNENYNILLLLHISPNVKDLSETISTLQFGERIIKFCHHKTGKEKMQLINNTKK